MEIVVVLDNVRSAHNVGAVFRSADSLGANELILCGISATPPHKEIHKSALGAELSVPFRYFQETSTALQTLKDEGYRVVAVEQVEGAVMLQNFVARSDEKYAFVLGNEVDGVSKEALELCHSAVEIEQKGVKKSLNVSVAAGIVLFCVTNPR